MTSHRAAEEVVKPTGQQQSALERLKQTSENAADELRASCPTRTAEAPLARLDEMHNRLGAMVQAVKNLRPTLGTFYASLSHEHGQRVSCSPRASPSLGGEARDRSPLLTRMPYPSFVFRTGENASSSADAHFYEVRD